MNSSRSAFALKSRSAFAPATVANLCAGFDVLGLCLESPGDTVTVSIPEDAAKNSITVSIESAVPLPIDPARNAASVVAASIRRTLGRDDPLHIHIKKGMPVGSGLGSSSASAAAAAVATNSLFGDPFTRHELVTHAIEGERISCGAGHADNVAPALLGGIVLVRSYEPLDIIELPVPTGLFCTVVHPEIEVRTEDARRILKQIVPLKSAVAQLGNIGGFIAALYKNDLDLLSRSLDDVLVEPYRRMLIPGFEKVKKRALLAGALGVGISGSGPAIFSLHTNDIHEDILSDALRSPFLEMGIKATVYRSECNRNGAVVL